MELRIFIPQNKFDLPAVARAKLAGFPAITPILPEPLLWLQDMNWPVAQQVAELLFGAGPEIVPHIRAVLRSDDGIWKYWLLSSLCGKLAPLVLAQLIPDIRRLANAPSEGDRAEDLDTEAKRLLVALQVG